MAIVTHSTPISETVYNSLSPGINLGPFGQNPIKNSDQLNPVDILDGEVFLIKNNVDVLAYLWAYFDENVDWRLNNDFILVKKAALVAIRLKFS